jgi:hypothetical protein
MSRTGKEHTMKRTIVILGVTAAMVIAPAVASAGNSPRTPAKSTKSPLSVTLQIKQDGGQTLYRLGNSDRWMY